jgi:hypothetical protein
MTPPRLVKNRTFFGLNLSTLMIYSGLAIMFFLLPFDLVDRRGMTPIDSGLAFLPFTLGVGLLSRRSVVWRIRSGHGRCSSLERLGPHSPLSGWHSDRMPR